MTDLWTTSRLRLYRECPRKHRLRYIDGLTTPPTSEMLFGTVGHSALEAYYRAWMAGDLEGRVPAALAHADELSQADRVKMRLLVCAYDARWGDEPWEILAVEVEFRYELDGRIIGGKIDAIVRDFRDGCVFVLEHKFTGSDTSLGGPYWERLTLDSQVSTYIDGAAMLGYDVAGCIYDVIKRPEHTLLEATPPDVRRYTVGKGCGKCGGSAKPGAVARGRGHLDVAFASVVEHPPCDGCAGTGWKLGKDGKPGAPRLDARQREHDETLDEFEERMLGVISERPLDFLQRGHIVRLEHELPLMRIDLIDWITLAESGLAPRNDGACVRAGRMCGYWSLCAGRAQPDDFQRAPAHAELAATT